MKVKRLFITQSSSSEDSIDCEISIDQPPQRYLKGRITDKAYNKPIRNAHNPHSERAYYQEIRKETLIPTLNSSLGEKESSLTMKGRKMKGSDQSNKSKFEVLCSHSRAQKQI